MSHTGRGYVAVIPVLNEAASIADLVARVRPEVEQVVVVDDGSIDGTAACLGGQSVTVLRNAGNQGKGASLFRGFRKALEFGPQGVITLDGDGQHLPEDIPGLLLAADSHSDSIIIAARLKNRGRAPRLRRLANRFADFWISWAAGYPIRDSQSGFRVYPAGLLRGLTEPQGIYRGFAYESDLLIEAARRGVFSESVPIDTIYSESARKSHYRPYRDTRWIVRVVARRLIRQRMYLSGLLRAIRVLPDPRFAKNVQ